MQPCCAKASIRECRLPVKYHLDLAMSDLA